MINANTELGLSNVTIQLYDEQFNVLQATTVTNSFGMYEFTNNLVATTTYGVRALAPLGYTPKTSDLVVTALCGTTYVATFSLLVNSAPLSVDPLTRAIQEKYFGLVV